MYAVQLYRGGGPKLESIKIAMETMKIDIAILTETWFKANKILKDSIIAASTVREIHASRGFAVRHF